MGADVLPLVDVSELRVLARDQEGRETVIVKNASFSIARGEVVALIGESGSGKTTIALSLMGYARPGCRIAGGRIRIGDTDVLSLSPRHLVDLRGRRVAYISQSAAAAFNPAKSIMAQVTESARIHRLVSREAAEAKAIELFRALALPDPDHVGERYPHQVSGGQLQRLMAAMALITDPDLVVLDEPTTALDVTTQIEVLHAFKDVVRERHTTAIYVSHDLAVVAQMADRIIVLRDGEIQEIGATDDVLTAPTSEYTKSLLAAAEPVVRRGAPAALAGDAAPPLLEVRGLIAGYGAAVAGMPFFRVLNEIDFAIRPGATLGVIGESGCGKSTLARVIAGLVPAAAGSVLFNGVSLPPTASGRSREQLRQIQIVFQMADTALNPAQTVERILGRPLVFYHRLTAVQQRKRVAELLDLVRLPAHLAERYPHELSGGQKQRVNLARALAAEPALILCDEVTSALDTVIGAAILDLMAELRRELGVAYMFISHDLSVIRAICDDVMVLYAGWKVEFGSRLAMASRPFHPYSDLLIASVPELRRGWLEEVGKSPVARAAAAPARAADLPACSFFDRCAARIAGVCDVRLPPVHHLSKGADILCHRTEQDLNALQSSGPIAPGTDFSSSWRAQRGIL
jgi:peptide/nickel transport system ATP-binding protein